MINKKVVKMFFKQIQRSTKDQEVCREVQISHAALLKRAICLILPNVHTYFFLYTNVEVFSVKLLEMAPMHSIHQPKNEI